MSIPLAKAAFLGLFLETLLYGVLLALYWFTLFILLKKTPIQRKVLIPVGTLLLCIATARLIVDFVRGLQAFVFQVDTIGANAYYFNLASPLNLASISLYITQTILGDGALIWRCYMLYSRSLFIAVAGCIVLLALGAIAYYVVWSMSHFGPLFTVSTAGSACITTIYVLTMFISVTCTSTSIVPDLQTSHDQSIAALIAWRIYRTRRFMPDGLGSFLPVFIVIIESGALYAMSVLALLVTSLVGSNGRFVIVCVIPPIIGITFCLIILQVHFHVGCSSPTEQPAETRSPMTNLFRGRDVMDAGSSLEPMTVQITEEMEIGQSDVMGKKNDQRVSGGIFQL
ncbi:uncharacterized protein EDB91DRAFT_1201141 [Suillus paluster]|uniref:uncharacterized protein n=1 Tax=Suillus paluster TaxID=48578 RepID=UPI001B883E6C|nr:uncharacterized protein EDB91DRAFT_1201141 [Suillus paluster]KAG1742744.1 hypothetical protein EDB91DRAFT_1201141 [Suillus paluster]